MSTESKLLELYEFLKDENLSDRDITDKILSLEGPDFNVDWQLFGFPIGEGVGLGNFQLIRKNNDGSKIMAEVLSNGMVDAHFRLVHERDYNNDPKYDSFLQSEVASEWYHDDGVRPEGLGSMTDGDRKKLAETIGEAVIRNNGYYFDDAGQKIPTIKRGTYDFRDYGIGVCPDDFPTTILSVLRKNSREKMYLTGAYGFGGSSSHDTQFCDISIVVSKRYDSDRVGFSVVMNRNDNTKEKTGGDYYYLVINGKIPEVKDDNFRHGTLKRHINTNVEQFTGKSLAHTSEPYTMCAKLFPKLALPFMIHRAYNPTDPDDRVVAYGLYDKLLEKNTSVVDPDIAVDKLDLDNSNPIAYQESQEIDVIVDGKVYKMGCHWFLLPMRHETLASGRVRLRTDQQRSYVEKEYPILIFENGQTRAELNKAAFLRDEIKYLQNNLIVFIQADSVPYDIRATVFNPNRESMKGTYEKAIRRAMQDAMCNDPVLKHFNDIFAQEKIGKIAEDSVSMCDDSLADFLNGSIGIGVNRKGTKGTFDETDDVICGGDEPGTCEEGEGGKKGPGEKVDIEEGEAIEIVEPPTRCEFPRHAVLEVRPGRGTTVRGFTNANPNYVDPMHPENSRISVYTTVIIEDDIFAGDDSNE